MFAKKELSVNIKRKGYSKKINQWVGLGYGFNHKLLFHIIQDWTLSGVGELLILIIFKILVSVKNHRNILQT